MALNMLIKNAQKISLEKDIKTKWDEYSLENDAYSKP